MPDLNVGDRFYPKHSKYEWVCDQVTPKWYRASSVAYPEKWFRKSIINLGIKNGTCKVLTAVNFDAKGNFKRG